MSTLADYKADVYVLALFKHQDHATLDILDMDQWCFYVLSKEKLREISGNRVSISLIKLEKLGYSAISFEKLAKAVGLQS